MGFPCGIGTFITHSVRKNNRCSDRCGSHTKQVELTEAQITSRLTKGLDSEAQVATAQTSKGKVWYLYSATSKWMEL